MSGIAPQEIIRKTGGLASQARSQGEFEQPGLSESQKSLGEQAFRTAVDPLREGFNDRLGKTVETLAGRGIAFGGQGTSNISDLLKSESAQEKNIAGQIGTSLQQTAMDQAFQINEAAKNRSLEKELQGAGFEFQASETEKNREFTAGENLLGREFTAGENLANRTLTEQLQASSQSFQGDQAALDRSFQETQNKLGRALTTSENAALRTFQENQAALQRAATSGDLLAQQTFQSNENRLQREFEGDRLEAQQTFETEQRLLDRTLTEDEGLKSRAMQETLLELQQTGQVALFDKQVAENRNTNLVNQALAGNLDMASAKDAIDLIFGEGAQLSTNDEVALRTIAAGSGLTVEEYKQVRAAIGTEQFNVTMDNLGDFVENPGADQLFMQNLELESINSYREINDLDTVTFEELYGTTRTGEEYKEPEIDKRTLPYHRDFNPEGYQPGSTVQYNAITNPSGKNEFDGGF